jgi:antirestriction protein ArdC
MTISQSHTTAAKTDVYQRVTDRVLAEIDKGCAPWRQPWTGSRPGLGLPKRVTGEAYRGINVLMLWVEAACRGYLSPTWITYRQAQELGGQVRKGERSAIVIKFGSIERADEDALTGEAESVKRAYAKAYSVFNVDQIDGLDPQWYTPPEPARDLGTTVPQPLLAWFAAMGVPITHSEEPTACYVPAEDRIHMPPIGTFESPEAYVSTLAHEMAHATKHETRLNRSHEARSREERYAREEVVAELAALMAVTRLGIAPRFEQSAAYLEHWAKVMREDSRAIVRAASMAQAAADWMFATAGEPLWTAAMGGRIAA